MNVKTKQRLVGGIVIAAIVAVSLPLILRSSPSAIQAPHVVNESQTNHADAAQVTNNAENTANSSVVTIDLPKENAENAENVSDNSPPQNSASQMLAANRTPEVSNKILNITQSASKVSNQMVSAQEATHASISKDKNGNVDIDLIHQDGATAQTNKANSQTPTASSAAQVSIPSQLNAAKNQSKQPNSVVDPTNGLGYPVSTQQPNQSLPRNMLPKSLPSSVSSQPAGHVPSQPAAQILKTTTKAEPQRIHATLPSLLSLKEKKKIINKAVGTKRSFVNNSNTSEQISSKAWVLQLGSFSKESNANALVHKLREKGYDAYVQESKVKHSNVANVFIGPEIAMKKLKNFQAKLKHQFQMTSVIKKYQA